MVYDLIISTFVVRDFELMELCSLIIAKQLLLIFDHSLAFNVG